MIRLILILIVAGLLALGAVWLADHDGTVTIAIADYEIRTGAGIAAFTVLAGVAALLVLARLVRLAIRGPRQLRAARLRRRRREGRQAVTAGLAAAAAGEVEDAQAAATRSQELLGDVPLVLLLRAEAARLSGDEARKEAACRAMLAYPETEFLAARGLCTLAAHRDDKDEALGFAARAQALKPKSASATEDLIELRLARGEWREAEALLEQAMATKVLSPDSEKRWSQSLAEAKARAAVLESTPPTG